MFQDAIVGPIGAKTGGLSWHSQPQDFIIQTILTSSFLSDDATLTISQLCEARTLQHGVAMTLTSLTKLRSMSNQWLSHCNPNDRTVHKQHHHESSSDVR